MWQAIAAVWAVVAIGFLVFLLNAARMSKKPTYVGNVFPTDAERAFLDAQHEAQKAFEDPEIGPKSPAYFFLVMRALDRWEEWQGQRLCTLQKAGMDPTEVEWHAISLINSLPTDQPAVYVH